MRRLNEPGLELAGRVVTEVGFDDRLFGYRLQPRVGPVAMTFYSFEEVTTFLFDPMPYLDRATLECWLQDVMGDEEVAESIRDVAASGDADFKKMQLVGGLMVERLGQCKSVMAVIG